jgi:hypothetical protein
MPWVVMTAFGFLVEPEVNRNLAMVSGPGLGALQRGERRRLAPGRHPAGHHEFDVGTTGGGYRAAEFDAVRGEHQAGIQQLDDVAQLGVILRHQRVGRRDRRIRHAHVLAGQSQQRVFEVVPGQDHDRAFDAEIARQQRLADGAHAVQRLFVRDVAPAAVRIAPGEEAALRRFPRPVAQAVHGAHGIVAERRGGRQVGCAIGFADQDRVVAECHRAVADV